MSLAFVHLYDLKIPCLRIVKGILLSAAVERNLTKAATMRAAHGWDLAGVGLDLIQFLCSIWVYWRLVGFLG